MKTKEKDECSYSFSNAIRTLVMKQKGISKLRNGIPRLKFVCPKIKWFMSILKKTFGLIPEPFAAPKSGIISTKPELSLNFNFLSFSHSNSRFSLIHNHPLPNPTPDIVLWNLFL